jgi:molecular chaperone DnaJ
VNLLVHISVAYHQAVLGSEVSVPTLDGASVLLKIKSGTQSGSKHRVKGRGIETTSKTGDLIVTIDVLIPSKVSKEERDIIEQLAELHNTSDKVK